MLHPDPRLTVYCDQNSRPYGEACDRRIGEVRLDRWMPVLGWLDRWWRTLIGALGTVLAVGGTYWGNFQVDGWHRVLFFAVAVAGALAAFTLPVFDRRKLQQEISALNEDIDTRDAEKVALEKDVQQALFRAKAEGRREFLFLADYGLIPILEQLGRVTQLKAAADRREAATSLKVQALNTLKEVTGPAAGKRATYFKLVDRNGKPRLVADKSTGQPTRPYFDDTTVEGRRALRVVETREPDFCPSVVEADPATIDRNTNHRYETFVAAAAYDGLSTCGLVAVDAPHKSDLSSVDKVVVRLVATLVAISEASIRGNN